MIKLIAFDLDNVLIDGEAVDEIGKLMDAETEIAEITKKAMEGDLEFEEALKERVALLKGASVDDIKDVVYKIPLMKSFRPVSFFSSTLYDSIFLWISSTERVIWDSSPENLCF